ncbi:MAG: 4-(cytidine 5'-diphospho)-2-C-methyl-D-erythritol kinase [Planctomycetota bacterium]
MSKLLLQPAISKKIATARAPSKINLTLGIEGRRQDGYHDLRSIVMGVDLCDRVDCTLTSTAELTVDCSNESIRGSANLAYQGVKRFCHAVGVEPFLRFSIEKAIPIGAGLGGGSSDAAAALRLGNFLVNSGKSDSELAEIGATVGSDVPLFFHLPSALMTGRGERVESVTLAWKGWALLVFVGPAVSTEAVYANWQPAEVTRRDPISEGRILQADSADELMTFAHNDLEPAVFRVCSAVGQAMSNLERHGLGPFRVSGAGSALFRLYDEKEKAQRDAAKFEQLGIGIGTAVVAAPTSPGSIVS